MSYASAGLFLNHMYISNLGMNLDPAVTFTLGKWPGLFGGILAWPHPPLTRLTLNFVGEKKGSAMAIFYLLMKGVGTLASVILSINESPITMSVVIGTSILFSYILNMGRQKRIRKRKA